MKPLEYIEQMYIDMGFVMHIFHQQMPLIDKWLHNELEYWASFAKEILKTQNA